MICTRMTASAMPRNLKFEHPHGLKTITYLYNNASEYNRIQHGPHALHNVAAHHLLDLSFQMLFGVHLANVCNNPLLRTQFLLLQITIATAVCLPFTAECLQYFINSLLCCAPYTNIARTIISKCYLHAWRVPFDLIHLYVSLSTQHCRLQHHHAGKAGMRMGANCMQLLLLKMPVGKCSIPLPLPCHSCQQAPASPSLTWHWSWYAPQSLCSAAILLDLFLYRAMVPV